MTGTAGICALGAASSLLRGLNRGLAVCLASTILGGMRAYPAAPNSKVSLQTSRFSTGLVGLTTAKPRVAKPNLGKP